MESLFAARNCETCVVSTSENGLLPQNSSEQGSREVPPRKEIQKEIFMNRKSIRKYHDPIHNPNYDLDQHHNREE